MLESYLLEIQRPRVLYHAASEMTKALVPRKSIIAKFPKNVDVSMTSAERRAVKKWDKKAVYAAEEADQAIPFGLERVNVMWPFQYTEEEVERWSKTCWFKIKDKQLQVVYYNHIPTKPVYLYLVDSKDFKIIGAGPRSIVKQWYSTKEIIPVEVKKLTPNQIKHSWRKASKGEWERKKQKYREKGWYK